MYVYLCSFKLPDGYEERKLRMLFILGTSQGVMEEVASNR